MNKHLFSFILIVIAHVVLFQNTALANDNAIELKRTNFEDFYIELPKDCTIDINASDPEEGGLTYATPNKDCIFFVMYFPYEDGYSQEEILIAEAAELDIELVGDGDIMNMKICSDSYLSFSITENSAIGVTCLYPEENIGLFFFIYTPNEDDGILAFNIITSIRAKELCYE